MTKWIDISRVPIGIRIAITQLISFPWVAKKDVVVGGLVAKEITLLSRIQMLLLKLLLSFDNILMTLIIIEYRAKENGAISMFGSHFSLSMNIARWDKGMAILL